MTIRSGLAAGAACALLAGGIMLRVAPAQQSPAKPRLYNTAKAKLMSGKPIVGATVYSPDPALYCAMANAGFDFTWIEMQHSPLTFQEVSRMIYACRGSAATPFIRVPDATESQIQKATDIGALGIIVPTVDTVEKALDAVKWSKYPPVGRRSQGARPVSGTVGQRLPTDRQRQHDGCHHDRNTAGSGKC